MAENPKTKNPVTGHWQAGGKPTDSTEDAVVNDSFGTVDPADSTGLDEDRETGDAKAGNKNTRED